VRGELSERGREERHRSLARSNEEKKVKREKEREREGGWDTQIRRAST